MFKDKYKVFLNRLIQYKKKIVLKRSQLTTNHEGIRIKYTRRKRTDEYRIGRLRAKTRNIQFSRSVYVRYSTTYTIPSRMCNYQFKLKEPGSHWVCYIQDDKKNTRIYFDSFGQITSIEVQKYLKTREEYESEKALIQPNTGIVHHVNAHVCDHLCLFVLASFQDVLNRLNDGYTQSDRKTTTS